MRRLAYSLFLVLLVPYANAQVRIQTFSLNKPITEQFVGCLEQKDAIDLANASAKDEQTLATIAQAKEKADVCSAVHWTITYHELVYEVKGQVGEHITVYRGTVNGKNIFVPMSGYTHIEVRI